MSVRSAALSVRFAVLSPILFLVYIDDLEEGVTGNIIYLNVQMTLNCSEKLSKLGINKNYKMKN